MRDTVARATGQETKPEPTAAPPESVPPPAAPREPLRVAVAIDPFVDAQNGHVVVVGKRMESAIAAGALEHLKGSEFQPLSAASHAKSNYVMSGSISFENRTPTDATRAYRVRVSLTDSKTGLIAAQSSAWLADEWLSNDDLKRELTALPIYEESPVFLNDKYSKALVDTTKKSVGEPADSSYYTQLTTAALVAEAQQAYTAQDTNASITLLQRAEERPDGKTPKVYAGLYTNYLKSGRMGEAEQTFKNLIALAFQERNLSIKFLFEVNKAELSGDPRFKEQYPMWTRQLAQHITQTGTCVDVRGHSSRSGDARYNEQLSRQRAERLRRHLLSIAPGITNLTRATGRGFQDAIVGSGTDDARDAVDRRVEMIIIDCAQVRG